MDLSGSDSAGNANAARLISGPNNQIMDHRPTGDSGRPVSTPRLPSQNDGQVPRDQGPRHQRFLSASHSARTTGAAYEPRPYFRSRRIRKGTVDRPELREKDPRALWITLIPLMGFFGGLAVIAVLSWTGYTSVSNHEYCVVFVDDFSNGFNSTIWSKHVETGGYGNGEFEVTTGGDENVFVRDGQLVIRPTIQTDSYIAQTEVTNLTADGTCTSGTPGECILTANLTAGEIVQPVKSGRISTKDFAVIRYGRVDVTAKLAAGDWLLSQLLMFPAEDYYGSWPASGGIDIGISRGNNYSYGGGQGNQLLQSALHWGPDPTADRWQTTTGARHGWHAEYHEDFHTFGLEWTERYLFTWVDSRLAQVTYVKFSHDFYRLGGFGATYGNGSRIVDPWEGAGTSRSTPFDRPFYLILSVGVGGTSGWFADGVQGKPWADASTTPRKDFWDARHQWGPTWEKDGHGELVVKRVSMHQQCDDGATDLSGFS
ncbi:Glycosyl hydrolases family 16 [Geosmithia morbida]|uniref:Glycosyl hydrolases family 16 n=1 Tax=Geosmithia morbida TaxID=1094350 RepID=A0A9P4YMN3_9HYPO|nr:Glycosyl hydrolases family 16 [Geosmithia morbida]KAF4119262.1 Glycosyl hydrolases family 16 [Geosmithia morbida]